MVMEEVGAVLVVRVVGVFVPVYDGVSSSPAKPGGNQHFM